MKTPKISIIVLRAPGESVVAGIFCYTEGGEFIADPEECLFLKTGGIEARREIPAPAHWISESRNNRLVCASWNEESIRGTRNGCQR